LVVFVVVVLVDGLCRAQTSATLSDGAKVVWDLKKAYRETTATQERICINGLWRFQPCPPDRQAAEWNLEEVPTKNWGFFRIPGPWPDPHRNFGEQLSARFAQDDRAYQVTRSSFV